MTLLKLEDEKEAAVSSDGQDKNSQETDGGNEGEEKSAKSTENKADEGKGKDVEEVKITEEEQKTAGEKKKDGVVDAPKKPDRTVNNTCQSRLFVPTAKVDFSYYLSNKNH